MDTLWSFEDLYDALMGRADAKWQLGPLREKMGTAQSPPPWRRLSDSCSDWDCNAAWQLGPLDSGTEPARICDARGISASKCRLHRDCGVRSDEGASGGFSHGWTGGVVADYPVGTSARY